MYAHVDVRFHEKSDYFKIDFSKKVQVSRIDEKFDSTLYLVIPINDFTNIFINCAKDEKENDRY